MADKNEKRPIILKRKKVFAAEPHHGGAWKVAYADFVTAMMAFFMLMWLLNATTEQQRKGIADYFSPTIPITRISGGGDGAFGGDSVFSETIIAQNGTGATSRRPTEGRQSLGTTGLSHTNETEAAADQAALEAVEATFSALSGVSTSSDLAYTHVDIRLTDEGLIFELYARPGRPLFDPQTGQPAAWLPDLAEVMVSLFDTVTNDVAIEGHLAAEPIVVSSETRWQGSIDRAQSMRGLLERAGLPPRRITRVTGHADREPAVDDVMAPRNDRVEIILLRQQP